MALPATAQGGVCPSYLKQVLTTTDDVKEDRNAVPSPCLSASPKFNPLNPELNPICYLLALLGAHCFLHVSRIRVKSLTLKLLMSYIYIYIYGAPILDVSRSHITTQHSR